MSLSTFHSCVSTYSEYGSIPHYPNTQIKEYKICADTLFLDSSMTSLEGQWLLCDSSLYFLDKYSVGVKQYSLDGKFISDHITMGRGPNEMLAPAWVSTLDKNDNSFVICDQNSFIWNYRDDFNESSSTYGPWFMQLETSHSQELWDELLDNPNPDSPSMYEYNFRCKRIECKNQNIHIPVITEHIRYNGYDLACNAKDFWSHSAIFLRFDIGNIAGSRMLLGHYPPVYQKHNIPIFSTYDFCTDEDGHIITSFSADSKIYVLDELGIPIYSFGVKGHNISLKLPETKTFEEYEMNFDIDRQNNGYYDRLFIHNNQLLRTYHNDKEEWRMQVYDNQILTGDISIGKKIEIIGWYDGYYYAYHSIDYDNDIFKIIKFTIQ